jgi:predicted nucleic acid-binding protein
MIFVDTGAWIALLNQSDKHHHQALQFQRELSRGAHGRMVTTDYVLDEAVTYLRLLGSVESVREFRRVLTESESVQVVWTATDRFWEAWQRMEDRSDKAWSLTDCLSFVTMESLGIETAFGFDADFIQAGFVLAPA